MHHINNFLFRIFIGLSLALGVMRIDAAAADSGLILPPPHKQVKRETLTGTLPPIALDDPIRPSALAYMNYLGETNSIVEGAARLAESKSRSSDVRQAAVTLKANHLNADQDLTDEMDEEGLPINRRAVLNPILPSLTSLSGTAFDKVFLKSTTTFMQQRNKVLQDQTGQFWGDVYSQGVNLMLLLDKEIKLLQAVQAKL